MNSLPKHSLFLIVLGYLILLSYTGVFSYTKGSLLIEEAENIINKTEISSEINIESVKPKSIDLKESIKTLKQANQLGVIMLIITGIAFIWIFNRHTKIHEINERFIYSLKLVGNNLAGKQIRQLEYKWVTMQCFEDHEALMEEIKNIRDEKK